MGRAQGSGSPAPGLDVGPVGVERARSRPAARQRATPTERPPPVETAPPPPPPPPHSPVDLDADLRAHARQVDSDGDGLELGAVVASQADPHDRPVAIGGGCDDRVVALDDANRLRPGHRGSVAVAHDVPDPQEARDPVVRGPAQSSSGAATWARRPSRRIATRSPRANASPTSCVTWTTVSDSCSKSARRSAWSRCRSGPSSAPEGLVEQQGTRPRSERPREGDALAPRRPRASSRRGPRSAETRRARAPPRRVRPVLARGGGHARGRTRRFPRRPGGGRGPRPGTRARSRGGAAGRR